MLMTVPVSVPVVVAGADMLIVQIVRVDLPVDALIDLLRHATVTSPETVLCNDNYIHHIRCLLFFMMQRRILSNL